MSPIMSIIIIIIVIIIIIIIRGITKIKNDN